MTRFWKYIFLTLILILSLLLIALTQLPDGNLHIIACDVGQGDAILVTFKNIQILTDGGPDAKVMDCLGKYIPFWDRDIELVVSTHPDADHSTGLINVIKKYNVGTILINPIDPGTQVYKALENAVGGHGVRVVRPVEGLSLGLDLIHLDIFNPTQELNAQKFSAGDDTNVYSIVTKLSFGSFSGLLLGDIPPAVSDQLSVNSNLGRVNYIKVPHHGSANGLTENLLISSMPKVAVISVGAKNLWGFPSPVILDLLNKYGVKTLRTDQTGDIEVITNGGSFWTKDEQN